MTHQARNSMTQLTLVCTQMLSPMRDFSTYCLTEWKKCWKAFSIYNYELQNKQTKISDSYILPAYLHMLCMSLLGHFFHAWIIHYVSKVLICFAAHTKLSISSHKLRTQGIIPSKYVSHVITERGFSLSGYDTQQMRQSCHRFSSLPKIQKELIKLIKNPKRFCDLCNTTNVQGLRSFQNRASQKCLQKILDQKFQFPSKK